MSDGGQVTSNSVFQKPWVTRVVFFSALRCSSGHLAWGGGLWTEATEGRAFLNAGAQCCVFMLTVSCTLRQVHGFTKILADNQLHCLNRLNIELSQ